MNDITARKPRTLNLRKHKHPTLYIIFEVSAIALAFTAIVAVTILWMAALS